VTPRQLKFLDWMLISVATGAVAAVAWAGMRWWTSSVRASKADAELAIALELVDAVERARALPAVLAEASPAGDQLSVVRDTLGRAGLPESLLRRVQAEADGASERIEGVTLPIRRSAMRVELDGLTLPELGRFLGTWRTQNTGWTPVLMNLSPRPETVRDGLGAPQATSRSSAEAAPPRWTVSLSMAAMYLASDGQGKRASADAGDRCDQSESFIETQKSRRGTGMWLLSF
jgi:hypothetical protein